MAVLAVLNTRSVSTGLFLSPISRATYAPPLCQIHEAGDPGPRRSSALIVPSIPRDTGPGET